MSRKKRKKRMPITLEIADDIRRLVAGGATLTFICEQYGISKPYASLISRNLRKKRKAAFLTATQGSEASRG